MRQVSNPSIRVSADVQSALDDGRPVVALESTIICHGMPWPGNAETAIAVEAIIDSEGAVPATIAVIDGQPRIGLERLQIEQLAKQGSSVPKVSRRDLPIVIATGSNGATTVAATMRLAALAGIRVFATGGIGGVHRGVESSMDVSADLTELAQTDVAVVCAGIKSVLDIPRTLEYLETLGVPVLGFGTDELPAFYARSSGRSVDRRVDDAREAAAILHAKWGLGIPGGVVIANPVPASHAMPEKRISAVIDETLAEMYERGIEGKTTTPFLLQRIADRTGGESLAANVALVLDNARLAARIATEYQAQSRGRRALS